MVSINLPEWQKETGHLSIMSAGVSPNITIQLAHLITDTSSLAEPASKHVAHFGVLSGHGHITHASLIPEKSGDP